MGVQGGPQEYDGPELDPSQPPTRQPGLWDFKVMGPRLEGGTR